MITAAEKQNLITSNYSAHIINTFKEQGISWLNELPSIIKEYESKWQIQVKPAFKNISYNYVAPAKNIEDKLFVLKIGIPNLELTSEIKALNIFNGHGINQIFKSNIQKGIMLLEKLRPGKLLTDINNDDQAMRIAALVMKNLRQPIDENHNFPSIKNWFESLDQYQKTFKNTIGPIPDNLISRAKAIAHELNKTSNKKYLLHGDLHHENIISATRKPWLAIDPKGVIGEPEYEVGALIRNPIPKIFSANNIKKTLLRRIDILHEMLSFDKKRMKSWAFSQAVLSAYWFLESSDKKWEQMINLAKELECIL